MAKPIKGGVYSSPIKLNEYPGDGPKQPVNPAKTDGNGGYSEKLPRK